jgi:prevent-host-death family protein
MRQFVQQIDCIYHNNDIILTQIKKQIKMPIIKPISDLRNKSNQISELANSSNEPIFITKNGEGDLVVMSMSHYSKLQLKIDLLSKLSVAQNQKAAGEKGRTLKQVMNDIRDSINAGR